MMGLTHASENVSCSTCAVAATVDVQNPLSKCGRLGSVRVSVALTSDDLKSSADTGRGGIKLSLY
jgi:hypothetical protein